MKINLPNQITIARLFLAIVFFVCLAQFDGRVETPRWWILDVSAALFIVAAITDIIDGYLARKYDQVTSFGRVIDPFVDKILVIGAYIFMAGDRFTDADGENISRIRDWMVLVVLGRELLVTSLRGVTEASGQSFGANIYGKLKMLLQSVTVVWVLLHLSHPDWPAILVDFTPYLVYIMVVVTAISVLPYLKASRSILSQMSVKKP
jgi:CDP-diacylglycerol--glycerol-3-phosphate 3-phosphatidyltransferase